jgi:hypothetical protein
VVSGIRVETDGKSLIQTTAAISSGSSGGPLLDELGRVVGVTTFMVTNGQSLNFCISSKHVIELLDSATVPYPLVSLAKPELSPRAERWRERIDAGLPFRSRVKIVGSESGNAVSDLVMSAVRKSFASSPDVGLIESDADWQVAIIAIYNQNAYTVSLVVSAHGFHGKVEHQGYLYDPQIIVAHKIFTADLSSLDERVANNLTALFSGIAADRESFRLLERELSP